MNTKEILIQKDHRPWPIPKEGWQFYQEWNDVVFLHFEVALEELKPFVPKGLSIDLFDGKAWISLVAFTMYHVRPKYLPPFAPISNFYELNVRTYVTANHKVGVYFLSIEAGSKLSCSLANMLSGLPYRYSKIKRNDNQFIATNNQYNDHFNCSFSIGNPIETKTAQDAWLTERYILFHDIEQSIYEFGIHHKPWTLHELNLNQLELQYNRFNHLIAGQPDKTHYSPGVQVLTWGRKKVII